MPLFSYVAFVVLRVGSSFFFGVGGWGDSFETIIGLFAQPIDGDTLSSWVGE